MYRSGFIAIIGRPNVGKSTLLNRLTGEKLAIVSPKPQTTRNRILGVVTRPEHQIAFLDTPGVHKAKGELNRLMVDAALGAISEVDAVLFIVEAAARPDDTVEIGEGNQLILQKLKAARKPTVLAINKVDALPRKPQLLPIIDTYRSQHPFVEIFPISALSGEGVAELEATLVSLLPEGPQLFPPEMVTDQAERFVVAELIREQILHHCREEIPYSTAVVVDHFDESERAPDKPVPPGKIGGLVRLDATVFVERDSQKAIVIGKGGQMLKKIGAASRSQIERFLAAHVYLSLLVKVEKRWSERHDALRRLGYTPRR
ncbi:MAG: GTPase Era [Deltaproteobacteria bacterium]|nr:GTPase Era [Deltaproteobacteria bacterium]